MTAANVMTYKECQNVHGEEFGVDNKTQDQ